MGLVLLYNLCLGWPLGFDDSVGSGPVVPWLLGVGLPDSFTCFLGVFWLFAGLLASLGLVVTGGLLPVLLPPHRVLAVLAGTLSSWHYPPSPSWVILRTCSVLAPGLGQGRLVVSLFCHCPAVP